MQPLKHSILKVIAYFDVFDYPVTVEEIKLYIDTPFAESELCFALQQLQQYNAVYRFNKFYSLRNEYALVERRINGNMLAEKKLKQAARIAKFLMWFPYIKGVAISGSLSKNFAYEGGDIDFFIITAANRLWLARTFFTAFYYLARFAGLKDFFCLNYFIDEHALEIPEKNVYTAIEIATLKPQQGKQVFVSESFDMTTARKLQFLFFGAQKSGETQQAMQVNELTTHLTKLMASCGMMKANLRH